MGEHDLAAPVAHSRELVDARRRGHLDIVAGAEHALLEEDADATLRAVLDVVQQ